MESQPLWTSKLPFARHNVSAWGSYCRLSSSMLRSAAVS